MRAAASVIAEQRPVRRASACVRKSRGRKFFTSPAYSRPRLVASKDVTGEIPLFPSASARKKSSRPSPTELTTPTPVMNTRGTADETSEGALPTAAV